MCCLTEAIDCGRYFKVGSNWADDEWGGAENYGNFTCKVGHFRAKLHFVLIPNRVPF